MGIIDRIKGAYQRRQQARQNVATQQQESGQQTGQQNPREARGKGGSLFSPTVIIEQPKRHQFWILFVLSLIFLWAGWKYGSLRITFVFLGALLFIFFIALGFYLGYSKRGPERDYTEVFIALALCIWLLDLVPSNLPLIGPFLGPPYAGFEIPENILQINWLGIITSGVAIVFLYLQMVFKIAKKDYITSALLFGSIIAANRFAAQFVPDSLTIIYGLKVPYIMIWLPLLLIVLIYIAWRIDKKATGEAIPDYFTTLLMVAVFGFFWINNTWMLNTRAVAHVLYILAFGFGYLKRQERDNPIYVRLLTIILLIADFFGYGLLWNSDYLYLKFIPIIVLCVIIYCYVKTENPYAILTFIFMVSFILILSLQATGYTGGTVTFQTKVGTDFTQFFNEIGNKVSNIVEQNLDYATGGLLSQYRGNVEKNQFEPLGVFFDRVKPAQPRFYTDEPVTVWATIKSRTLSDPVFVNFTCFRTGKDGKRIEANTEDPDIDVKDTVIPDTPFTVYTLEEKDTECTFNKNKLQTGGNTIFLSATYTFLTSAYQKFYLMDDERYRAMYREKLDPLKEFGITDRTPLAIATNGPVEIGTGISPLIPVSVKMSVDPALFITLTNREKINDKQGKPYGEWTGKIKQINELAVVLPKGITIEPDKCTPIKFKPYSRDECSSSCASVCTKTCGGLEDGPRKTECIDDCDLAKPKTKTCEEDCNSLFKSETGGSDYTGYSLRVEDIQQLKNKNDYRDIDRFRTFSCKLKFDKRAVLENTPITTKFIRIRARYDYLLEKRTDVTVEQAPGTLSSGVGTSIQQYAIAEGVDPDLIKALAIQESGAQHCNDGSETCPKDKVKFSGSSLGIMQVNIKEEPGKTWANDASSICKDTIGKTAYDIDCNINLGIKVLKEKYNQFKNGPPSNLEVYCPKNSPHFDKYNGYRGWNAAIRAYNGWGCLQGSDPDFVEKVNKNYELIKNGILGDEIGARLQTIEKYLPKTEVQSSYPPINPTAEYSGKRVILRWGYANSPKVTQYLISRYYQDNKKDSFSTSSNVYEDFKAEPNKEYKYLIMSIDELYTKYGSAEVTVSTRVVNSPTNAKAIDTPNAKNSITVSWTASTTPNVKYGVYRYNKQNGESRAYYIQETTYVDTDVQDGVEYYYKITALTDYQESEQIQTNVVKSIDDITGSQI